MKNAVLLVLFLSFSIFSQEVTIKLKNNVQRTGQIMGVMNDSLSWTTTGKPQVVNVAFTSVLLVVSGGEEIRDITKENMEYAVKGLAPTQAKAAKKVEDSLALVNMEAEAAKKIILKLKNNTKRGGQIVAVYADSLSFQVTGKPKPAPLVFSKIVSATVGAAEVTEITRENMEYVMKGKNPAAEKAAKAAADSLAKIQVLEKAKADSAANTANQGKKGKKKSK